MQTRIKIIGNGLIGSYLVTKGIELFPRFDLSTYKESSNIDFGKDNLYIFTAGMSKPQECEEKPIELQQIIAGTIEAIKEISKENKVIFLSSDVVLGKETSYSLSKSRIEEYIKDIVNVKIARLSYVFSDIKGFFDPFTQYAIEQSTVEVYADLKRNIIHLDDVADGLIAMALDFESTPNIVNLSGTHCIDKSALLNRLGKNMTLVSDIGQIDRFFETRDRFISIEPNFYMPKIDFS